ncbi:MAG TPA: TlpA disulfide reductase family protein [Candidatus Saccharimonadales bacterium]|jgi:cytochrome c biogenesis protein CcmG/thiol:disulfide interchange protein DsbE|nr:TlpA disulfide reductase family protein [Candidatus Saccharimonadales bacterium]
MPALEAGIIAPQIRLKALDGQEFSLDEAGKKGPVVLAFFKVSCPVCQLAFPFLERIYKAYGASGKFTLVGVSQDNSKDTQAFNRQFGVSFPVLLDDPGKFPASNAYRLTNVPSMFLISSAGEVELSSVGWSKPDMNELGRRLAAVSGMAEVQIVAPSERVPEFKPG